MTREFEYLMHLLAAAARGEKTAPPAEEIDWDKLGKLTREQSLEPLVGYGLKRSPEVSCPASLREELLGKMHRLGAYELRRRKLVTELMEAMEAEGVSVTLLKGFSVGRCYAVPECRVSSDTDILIPPEEEARACELLRQRGFVVRPRSANSHHTECTHPVMGLVELHVSLYDEIVEDVWFQGIEEAELTREPRRRRECPDGVFYTLGETDELIFLTLHAAKHFIFSGMSLRQIMDVAIFFANNSEFIDTDRFWRVMEKLRFRRLAECILWAAVEHFGFAAREFPGLGDKASETMAAVLDDLEKGGWLGHNDLHTREDGWLEYTRQIMLKERSQGAYERYMLRRRFAGPWRRIFPSRAKLAEAYPRAGECIWCVPWAWLRVCFGKLGRLLRGSASKHIVTDAGQLSESGQDRIRIFRELDMM